MIRIVLILITSLLTVFSMNLFAQVNGSKSDPIAPLNHKQIPEEVYFGHYPKGFRLSPNGEKVAFLAPLEGYMNLFVMNDKGTERQNLTSFDANVEDFVWADDGSILYVYDQDRDGNSSLFLRKLGSDRFMQITESDTDVKFPALSLHNGENVFFEMRIPESIGYDLHAYNILTQKERALKTGISNVSNWYVSPDGSSFLAHVYEQGSQKIIGCDKNQTPPFVVASFGLGNTFIPVAFNASGISSIYAISDLGKRSKSLIIYNCDKKKETKVIYAEDDKDVMGVRFNGEQTKPIVLRYEGASQGMNVLDSEFSTVNNAISSQLFAGASYDIIDASRDLSMIIIAAYTNRTLEGYYLFRQRDQFLIKLESARFSTSAAHLALQRKVNYQNSRGETIYTEQYIPGMNWKNSPAIIYFPEWPTSTSGSEHQEEFQYLANHGYHVVVFDYAKSSVFSGELISKGYSQWAALFQQEISDLIGQLNKAGISNPDRTVVMGESFGAFLASTALNQNNKMLRLGVFLNGILDINEYLSAKRAVNPESDLGFLIVDNDADATLLGSNGLLKRKDPIIGQLLFVHASKDHVVPLNQAESLVSELSNAGITSEFAVIEGGHDPEKAESEMLRWQSVLAFLDKHLRSAAKR